MMSYHHRGRDSALWYVPDESLAPFRVEKQCGDCYGNGACACGNTCSYCDGEGTVLDYIPRHGPLRPETAASADEIIPFVGTTTMTISLQDFE